MGNSFPIDIRVFEHFVHHFERVKGGVAFWGGPHWTNRSVSSVGHHSIPKPIWSVSEVIDEQTTPKTTATMLWLHQKCKGFACCRFNDLLTSSQPSPIVHAFAQNQILGPPQNSTPPLSGFRAEGIFSAHLSERAFKWILGCLSVASPPRAFGALKLFFRPLRGRKCRL